MYTTIKARVTDQTLELTNVPKIASGGEKETRVEVTFDDYWTGYGKTMVFYRDKKQVFHVVMADDVCVIPREVLTTPGTLYMSVIGVSGASVRTTEVVVLSVAQGAITGLSPFEPLPDVYKQILTAYGEATLSVALTNSRIDNILAGATTDSEVVDIRSDGYGVTHASARASVIKQVKDAVNSYTGLVYAGASYGITIQAMDNGALSVTFAGRLSRYTDKGSGAIEWTTAGADLGSAWTYAEGSEKRGTLVIPSYKSFVYNTLDNKYHIRNGGTCDTYDLLLIQNGYGNPVRGALVSEYHMRLLEKHAKEIYAVRGAYVYLGTSSYLTFAENAETETLDLHFIGRPTLCWGASSLTLDWGNADLLSDIANNVIVESNTRAVVKIPGWNAFVYNHLDGKYHMRWRAGLQEGDILILATGYCQPLCGPLLDEWTAKRAREYQAEKTAQTLNSEAPEALTTFAGLFNGTGVVESFMFFTDPHLCEGTAWQDEFDTYKAYLKNVYAMAPVTFALCGGDWLGNSDTQVEACTKLGYIDAQMRSIFPRYYPVVGNHDTNYQGKLTADSEARTGTLPNDTIRNLWMRGESHTYYEFEGENTHFYAFDTGIDWTSGTIDEYRAQQLEWVCDGLRTNPAENIAFTLHIFYGVSADDAGMTPFAEQLTLLAKAYNQRTSYTYGGKTWDFSAATGKVRYILSGHRHGDTATTVNTIPVLVTTDTRDSGVPSFDLVLADYDAGQLHAVRVGTGAKAVRTLNI